MKLIDRYLLREYLGPAVFCLTGLSAVFVLVDLLEHLAKYVKHGTPAVEIARYCGRILLPAAVYLMPAALLLAALYALWQLARNNELTAMRAGGVSLARIMAPLLGVGFAASLVTAAINEGAAPAAAYRAVLFVRNNFREPSRQVCRAGAFYHVRGRRLWLIGEFDVCRPATLHNVTVRQERPDGTRLYETTAPRAEFLDGRWWLYGARSQRFDGNDVPSGNPVPAVADADRPTEMPAWGERPDDIANSVREWEFLSVREMLRYLRTRPGLSDRTLAGKRFDLHNRLAMPWACLVVTLFGVPAGAGGARRNALTGVILAVACFAAFHALGQTGLFLGRRGLVSPWLGAWLSNIVFLAAGLGMIVRAR